MSTKGTHTLGTEFGTSGKKPLIVTDGWKNRRRSGNPVRVSFKGLDGYEHQATVPCSARATCTHRKHGYGKKRRGTKALPFNIGGLKPIVVE